MKYYSLRMKSPEVGFKEACINGQAPDGGLYFPQYIPALTQDWLKKFRSLSKAELAFSIMRPYVENSMPAHELFRICEETFSFEFPLRQLRDGIYSLELYHGPTLSFKDVGARFMSRCLSWFSRGDHPPITVLVATSGDTGSAVANGFLNVDGVEVVILYPAGMVSKIQELQMTTLGKNVRAFEVKGTFDDCQRMVKEAFSDEELKKNLYLTSANSINVARWLPQQVYYFFALQQWSAECPPVFSVPSGNFGNICSGLLAFKSGMPSSHFIAACNSNKVFTEFMKSGIYSPIKSVSTISNAMDVGNPSNFSRVMELFGKSHGDMKKVISSYSVNDHQTEETLWEVYRKDGYLLDPHGAVACRALMNYQEKHPGEPGIILETAHPVKFGEIIETITEEAVRIPSSVKPLLELQKQTEVIAPLYNELKNRLSRNELKY